MLQCVAYMLQIIYKKKLILQSKSSSFTCQNIFLYMKLTLKMPFNHQNNTRMEFSIKITRKRPRN